MKIGLIFSLTLFSDKV